MTCYGYGRWFWGWHNSRWGLGGVGPYNHFTTLLEHLTGRDLHLRKAGRPLNVASLKLVLCPRNFRNLFF